METIENSVHEYVIKTIKLSWCLQYGRGPVEYYDERFYNRMPEEAYFLSYRGRHRHHGDKQRRGRRSDSSEDDRRGERYRYHRER